MNSDKLLNLISYCLIAGLILVITGRLIYDSYKEEKLENSNSVVGFINKIWFSKAVHGSAYAVISYTVNGKVYEIEDLGDYRMFNIGDSVKLSYSLEKNEIAEVTDKFYMEKFHHKNFQKSDNK